MPQENLFTEFKMCKMCGRPLSMDYEPEYCPACTEEALFKEVREYIREHDVTEHMLAEAFDIPLKKVHKWIAEGRIEYVEKGEQKSIRSVFCQRCGAPISFGNFCPSCNRVMAGGKEKSYVSVSKDGGKDSSRMRYLDQES